jgi:4-alpha-glucanotransferase
MSERLKALAQRHGVALHYQDARGNSVSTDLGVVAKLLQSMGVLTEEGEECRAIREEPVLPTVLVVRPQNGAVVVDLLNAPERHQIAWTLRLENGEIRNGIAKIRKSTCDSTRSLVLPDIAFGYHRLELPELGTSTSLIVTPSRCYLPARFRDGERAWGISLQLYLLRSASNWGVGDFSDLARMAKMTADLGCDVLGLNPLHQMFPDKPEHASPYSPASRSFLNVLYIDVQAIPEFQISQAPNLVASGASREALKKCRASAHVSYTSVTRLKLEALRLVFDHFRSNATEVRRRKFSAFVHRGGDALTRSSLFQVLRDHFSQTDPTLDAWQRWPQPFHSPTSPEAKQFAHEHQNEIEFFHWLQWVADQQLSTASEAAAAYGMAIGLYRDLAVGCDRTGSETWSRPADFLQSVQVGAPPDILNPAGQNWGLPPFNPVTLKMQAYKPFIDLVRANMRHAGGLRIDHVMGLQRLYCIPEGSPASDGAFISYPIDDLIGILALESHRNCCLVVGEDLGTVPSGFREKMAAANISSYRVLFFEQQEKDGFIPPEQYPALAVAVAGSHDLPTLRSWLVESDIGLKQSLGLYPSEDEVLAQRSLRRGEREAVLKALQLSHPAPPEQFSVAVHRFLARTRAMLTMVQLDDLLGEHEPVNVPATSTEHPNWRRKYSLTLEGLLENELALKQIEVLRSERSRGGGTIGKRAKRGRGGHYPRI